MSNMFLNPLSQDDLGYEGFFDGQNKTIPDNTELEFVVTDGFVGIEEGKSQQVCMINIAITTPGEFYGQKYRYNAKIYDMDANKRDLAMRNLGVLDAQAGFPMTNGELPLTTENVQQYWVQKANARVKFGLLVSTENMDGSPIVDQFGEPSSNHINFVRGFAYDRAKMVQQGKQQQSEPVQQQVTAQQMAGSVTDQDDSDIDF
ncbi:hypothetical protein MYOV065v1_p0013 [Vibrio phage PS15B.2]|nr:hypothetical protein MYOV065v1_p0013 [Vibrio phage PS15B.2]QZI90863.1 hypothetical protein MYOV064v1_p0013 [Vibrio phage PS15B.4]